MSTLTPVEFLEHCDEEAHDAARDYHMGTVDMDVTDKHGRLACARCDQPATNFPTTLTTHRVETGGLTFTWTVCPDCAAALTEWAKKKETPDA